MLLRPASSNNFFRFSLLFLILISSFLLSKNVSAAEGNGGSSGGYPGNGNTSFAIATGTNQVLICLGVPDTSTPADMRWNGTALTNFATYNISGKMFTLGYLVNPAVGSYTIGNNNGGYFAVVCKVYENLNQATPIKASVNSADDYNFTVNYPNTLIAFISASTGGYSGTYPSTAWTNRYQTKTYFTGADVRALIMDDTVVNSGTYKAVGVGYGSEGSSNQASIIAELNYAPAIPPLSIESFIYDSFNGIITTWGYCTKYGSGIGQMDFYATSYPDPNGGWRTRNYTFGGDQFMTNIDCTTVSGETYAQWGAHYDTTGMVGTTTFFIDDTFYGSYTASTSLELLPIGSGEDWQGSYGYMSSDDPEYTAHNLACTDTEWATPDPVIGIDWLNATTSIAAFNFTVIKCNIIKQWWIATFGIRDQAKNAMSGTGSAMGNMFPFNFSTAINNSWATSASSTMPSSLAWLSGADANGNVNISVFNNSSSTAATSTPIWGTAIFSQSASSTAAYAGIRSFTTYLLWGLFFLWLLYTAYEVKNHLHK
jgi:hypothetical protein